MTHLPVLLHETIQGLGVQPGDVVLDCTAGGGGHAELLCRATTPGGTLIALDEDARALKRTSRRLKDCGAKVWVFQKNFRMLSEALDAAGVSQVNRVLFDLGVSSFQLDEEGRGFSFKRDEPLSMTLRDPITEDTLTAKEIVNEWEEEHLADIIFGYGQERYSRRIAAAICRARTVAPLLTTFALVDAIRSGVPARYANGRGIHFATRTFQALRIAVNDELGALTQGLSEGWERLAPRGRVAVISFHSLEDRIVKRFFKEREGEGMAQIHTKKPIEAGEREQKENPRARSAKLRIAEKL
ncbi:MAG: 16S rRNA (cytosine(1402)-N(4))-methyltransferase RsmH [Minisyncoccota bacterium]